MTAQESARKSEIPARFRLAVTLDPNWVIRSGGYTTTAQPGRVKGTTALNHMTLGRLDVADVDMRITTSFSISVGSFGALTARVSAGPDPDFYQAILYSTAMGFNADIFKRVGGVFTQLATVNLGGGVFGPLRFTVIGAQLKLFTGGVERLSVFDFSLKSGSVGIRSPLDTTFDDFNVLAPV